MKGFCLSFLLALSCIMVFSATNGDAPKVSGRGGGGGRHSPTPAPPHAAGKARKTEPFAYGPEAQHPHVHDNGTDADSGAGEVVSLTDDLSARSAYHKLGEESPYDTLQPYKEPPPLVGDTHDNHVLGSGEVAAKLTPEQIKRRDQMDKDALAAYNERQKLKEVYHPPVNHDSLDCPILFEMYYSLGGQNWKKKWDIDFSNGAKCCSFHGITCNSKGFVSEIDLSNNGLVGTIPATIGQLNHMTDLVLRSNEIGGNIPPSIGNLHKLKVLGLGYNKLTGALPNTVGDIVDLEYLVLSQNQLGGPIPESLGKLKKLVWLLLAKNRFTGSVPASLGKLTSLQNLYLNDNLLVGDVPKELLALKLKELKLENNKFHTDTL